jgi:hypothetical protein
MDTLGGLAAELGKLALRALSDIKKTHKAAYVSDLDIRVMALVVRIPRDAGI